MDVERHGAWSSVFFEKNLNGIFAATVVNKQSIAYLYRQELKLIEATIRPNSVINQVKVRVPAFQPHLLDC